MRTVCLQVRILPASDVHRGSAAAGEDGWYSGEEHGRRYAIPTKPSRGLQAPVTKVSVVKIGKIGSSSLISSCNPSSLPP